tara:strand:- start:2 stop:2209 length:2208 start_codon:yes stop_codon:yes gene_type:complete
MSGEMNEIKLNEMIELKNVKYLLSLNNAELGQHIDPYNKYGEKRTKEDIQHYLNGIKKYLNKINEEELTEREVPYSIKGCNRLYHSGTGFVLQQLACDYRNFIINQGCKDYDMKNAHPTILLKLTVEAGLPHIMLKNYVENRQIFLEENEVDKQQVLRLLNQDKPKKQNGTLQLLVAEVLQNKKKIIELHKNKLHKKRKKNIKNPNSSAISNILCYYENMLLHRVIEAGIPVSIPMYDGFIAPPDTTVDINELNALTEDYGIIWTNKELETPFELEEFEEVKSYKSMKEQFEKEVQYIMDLNIYKRRSEIDGEWKTYTTEKIKSAYKKWRTTKMTSKGEVPCDFFEVWLEDPDRLDYERCEFEPYGREENSHPLVFNLFRGWENEEAENTGDFEKWFIEDYLNIFCKGKQEVIEYILNYIAHIVQYPQRNPKVAIVLKGYEGTGKDSLIDFIQFLIGQRYVYRVKGMTEVFGDWNDHLADKLILSMNEVSGKDGVNFEEDLKEQITKETLNVRERFVSSYNVGMYWRMFVLSNNDSPIQYSPTDRRFLMIEIADALMGNQDFWKTYHTNIRDKQKMSEAYTYFMNRNIECWNIKNIPITETMKNMGTRKIKPPYIYLYRELSKLSEAELEESWSVRSSVLNTACENIARFVLGFTGGYKKKQVSICMEKKMDYIQIKNKNEGHSSCRHYVIDNPKLFLNHLKLVDCKIYKEEALDFCKLNSEYFVNNEWIGFDED